MKKYGWGHYQSRVACLSCIMARDMSHTGMTLEQLDELLSWQLENRKIARSKMQDQITIELRVDFKDKDKIPELIKVACAVARHLVANVMLLGPTCKPDCVVFTDNFMSPPEKIDIYQDLIAKGQSEFRTIADNQPQDDNDTPSDEMLRALRGK